MGNTGILNESPNVYEASPEKIIKDHLSYQQTAFDIYKSEENINRKVSEILYDYNCIREKEIQSSSGDLNYNELNEEEIYPANEINEFLQKRIYLPQASEDKIDPFKFEDSHMSNEQSTFKKNIFSSHKSAISTPSSPLGSFKLFQATVQLFPGKKSVQHKRTMNFDLINEDIQRMITLGIISENMSNDLDTLANLVIVSKSARLCKADKYVEKNRDPYSK